MRPLTLALLSAAALYAQSAGEIRGFAWSAEGRPIPEAKITIHSADAKADRTVTAGPDGAFDIRDLKPGRYEVSAVSGKQQLASESATSVEVKAGEMAHTDLTLGVSTVHHGYWSRLVRRLDGLH